MAKGIARALLIVALSIGGTAAADTFEPSLDGNGVVATPRHATGSWIDVGFMYGRVEPIAGTTISTQFVRFGPRAALNRFLYVGAEVDIGHLSGNDPPPTNLTARDGSSSGESDTPMVQGVAGGTLAAGKALVGAHAMFGPLSAAGEFSAGIRDYMTRDALGQFGQGYFGGVYELHGRVDLWATPALSVGALASVDLEDRNDVSVGIVVGFHFLPYDGQRR